MAEQDWRARLLAILSGWMGGAARLLWRQSEALADRAAQVERRGAVDVSPRPDHASGGPPEHWLKRVRRAGSAGAPPVHWVEHVRGRSSSSRPVEQSRVEPDSSPEATGLDHSGSPAPATGDEEVVAHPPRRRADREHVPLVSREEAAEEGASFFSGTRHRETGRERTRPTIRFQVPEPTPPPPPETAGEAAAGTDATTTARAGTDADKVTARADTFGTLPPVPLRAGGTAQGPDIAGRRRQKTPVGTSGEKSEVSRERIPEKAGAAGKGTAEGAGKGMAGRAGREAGADPVSRWGNRPPETGRLRTAEVERERNPASFSRPHGSEEPWRQVPPAPHAAAREPRREQGIETDVTRPHGVRDGTPAVPGWEWEVQAAGEEKDHWPALPGTAEAERDERAAYQAWQARVRAWQHRQRLDCEQRGELWSE